MATVTFGTLNLINKSIQKEWNDAVTKKTYATKIARTEVKNTHTFTLKWLHDTLKLAEYNIPAQPNKPATQVFGGSKTYTMRDWARILTIRKQDIEDDDIGLHMTVLKEFADALTSWTEEQIVEILNNGETTICMTGENFFANTHDVGGGASATNDNLLAGTGTSDLQISADFDTARVAMLNYTNAQNIARNIMPTMAMCPPELEMKFRRLLNSSYTTYQPAAGEAGQNAENVFKGVLRDGVESDARFDDANDWYLLSSTASQAPFINAVKSGYENVKPIPKINITDDNVYYQDEFHWLIETHRIVVAGWPTYAIKVVNA